MKQPNRRSAPSRARAPLDRAGLEALAVAYAGRYLTTRGKLAAYLSRKVAERGGPDDAFRVIEDVVARAAANGYVDDRAFAGARAAEHTRRGLGAGRLRVALRVAGVEADDANAFIEGAEADAWEAALTFARRRRLGPFGPESDDPKIRRRAFGALVRAGHSPALAARVLALDPGELED